MNKVKFESERMHSGKLTPADLVYAAHSRCPCGAGLAHVLNPVQGTEEWAWDCSAILTGTAIPTGEQGTVQHTARLPFAFYEVKSENQPSAGGATTRPAPMTANEKAQRELAESEALVRVLASQLAEHQREGHQLEGKFRAAQVRHANALRALGKEGGS